MSELGEAKGKITIDGDFTGLDRGAEAVDRFKKKVESGTGAVRDFGPALDTVSRDATIMGGALLAGFAVAAGSAANFEQRLSAIQAVSGATAEEMDLISEAALRIGAETSFSASEAASAMEELVKAGLSVEDTLNGAADATVALAAAGEIGLPEAATIASNAMNQFNLEAEDMVRVSDLIAGAANASAIDVGQFGNSLSQVGAVANLVGLSFDDTSAAIALMGNAGIVGSDAGTSLKAMLMRLNPSTKEASDLMQELGIMTAEGANQFYNADGSMKTMAEVADVLGRALAGMTEEQKQATLTTLFGADAIRGAAIIAEGGSAAFNEMATAMTAVSAADVAATRMDNFKGSVEEMMGSLETLSIRIGQTLLPRMRELVDQVTMAINWFGALDDETLASAAAFGVSAGGILLAVGATAAFIGKLMAMRTALLAAVGANTLFATTTTGVSVATKIATAATALWNAVLNMNPIVRMIGIILAVTAAIITMAGGWDQVAAAFAPLMDTLMSAFAPLLPVLQEVATVIVGALVGAISALVPPLMTLAMAIMPIIISVFEAIAPLIGALAAIISAILVPVLSLLEPLFAVLTPVIMALLSALQPLIDLLMMLLVPVLDVIVFALQALADGLTWVAEQVTAFFSSSNGEVSEAQSVWDTFVSWLTGVWNGIVTFFQDTATNISNFFTTMGDGIATAWNAVVAFFQTIGAAIAAPFIWLGEQMAIIWAGIMTVIQPVIDWFATHIVPLIQAAIGLVVAIVMFLFNTWVNIWTAIITYVVNIATQIWSFLVTIFTAIWTFLVGIFTAIWTTVVTIFTAIWTTISGIVTSIWNTIVTIFTAVWSFISSIFQQIYNFISSIVTNVWNFIVNTWNGIVSFVSGLFEDVYNSIKDPLDRALDFIGGIKDKVLGFFADAGSWLLTAGENIINGLIAGIEGAVGWLTDSLGWVTSLIPESKGPEEVDKKLLTPNGQLIMEGLMRGIANRVPELESMLGNLTATMPNMMASANVNQFLAATPASSISRAPLAAAGPVIGTVQLLSRNEDPGEDITDVMHTLRVYQRGGQIQ